MRFGGVLCHLNLFTLQDGLQLCRGKLDELEARVQIGELEKVTRIRQLQTQPRFVFLAGLLLVLARLRMAVHEI